MSEKFMQGRPNYRPGQRVVVTVGGPKLKHGVVERLSGHPELVRVTLDDGTRMRACFWFMKPEDGTCPYCHQEWKDGKSEGGSDIMSDQKRHVFSLGAQHNICQDCGSDIFKGGKRYECPGVLTDLLTRDTIIRGGLDRGWNNAIEEVGRLLRRGYDDHKEAYPSMARYLWELARDLPRRDPVLAVSEIPPETEGDKPPESKDPNE